MRWSDRTPLALAVYALAGALAVFELGVLWQAIHPDVSPQYRAYYIDRSTTCLPQPVTGDYVLGTEIDFRSGAPSTRELRPCGWDGPAGDGMHAIGETSRLRLATGAAQDLDLMLELTGVSLKGPDRQRVHVHVNDADVGLIEVVPGQTERYHFAVPASAIGTSGFADIRLDFPDSIPIRKGASNTFNRSVKLTAAALTPAVSP